MPTGYTEIVEKDLDKEVSLKDFALRCARGIDYLFSLRDNSLDNPLPKMLKPHTSYYDKEIVKIKEKIKEAEEMSLSQAEKLSKAEYREQCDHCKKFVKKDEKLLARYELLMKAAQEWKPPTAKHQGLKDFMLDQLKLSMRHLGGDYSWFPTPKKLSPKEWRSERVKELKKELRYHEVERRKEIKRAKESTLWLKQLRESL